MSKITYIGGDLIEEIGGSYTIFAKEGYEITAMKQIIFNAKEGITYGEPESPPVTAPKVGDNAFVPIVLIDASDNAHYKVYEDKGKTWGLDNHIDEDKRKTRSMIIKFKNKEKLKIKFNVKKGNVNANDSDGGIITAFYYKKEDQNHQQVPNMK